MRQIKRDMRNLKHIKALFLSQKTDEGKCFPGVRGQTKSLFSSIPRAFM